MKEAILINENNAVIKNCEVSNCSVGVQEDNSQHGVVIKNCRVTNDKSSSKNSKTTFDS
jgi:hypothetical protein